MNKILLFVIVTGLVTGFPATMNITLDYQSINNFTEKILDLLNKNSWPIRLPNINGSQGSAKFSIEEISLTVEKFKKVELTLFPNNIIRIYGIFPDIGGNARVDATLGPVKVYGNINIGTYGVSFNTNLSLISVSGKPNIHINEFDYKLEKNRVRIDSYDPSIKNILSVFEETTKDYITKSLLDVIPRIIPAQVYYQVNTVLNSSSTDIKLIDKMYVKYNSSVAPITMDRYTITRMEAYFYSIDNPVPPLKPNSTPEFNIDIERGIQFFFSEYFFKTGIQVAQELGLLYLNLNFELMFHQLDMICSPYKTPDLSFLNFESYIKIRSNCTCNVTLDNNPDLTFAFIFDFESYHRVEVRETTMFFPWVVISYGVKSIINDKKIDLEWFKQSAIDALGMVVKKFYNCLEQKGIPLPSINGISYENPMYEIQKKFLMIGATPVFNFHVANEDMLNYTEVIEIYNNTRNTKYYNINDF